MFNNDSKKVIIYATTDIIISCPKPRYVSHVIVDTITHVTTLIMVPHLEPRYMTCVNVLVIMCHRPYETLLV